MKLSQIYSNKSNLFEKLIFNTGLNVLYAKITNPKDTSIDSHNLGKTLFSDVIDYCLLKEIDKDHFTKKLPKELAGLDFYLELQNNQNKFITIKRPLEPNTKISIKIHDERHADFSSLPNSQWDHSEIPIKTAQQILDSFLNLDVIKPFHYRAGISYFLRKQKDYLDVFQIEKFSAGKHIAWKPYIGKLLGLNHDLIIKKYQLDERIIKKEEEKEIIAKKVTIPTLQYDEVKARIEIKEKELNEIKNKLDSFSFVDLDLGTIDQTVKTIEQKISDLNNQLYLFESELQNLNNSIESKITFKTSDIEKVFTEAKLYFPDSLKKDYEDLINFNKKISKDRLARLNERKQIINKEVDSIKRELTVLDTEREKSLSIIRERETFTKYKKLHSQIIGDQSDLNLLQNQIKSLNEIRTIEDELDIIKNEQKNAVISLTTEVRRDNHSLTQIREEFSRVIKKTLNQTALLFINQNDSGNLDFEAHFTVSDKVTSPTAESEGTSYKKMLCIAFDLAVLNYYKNSNFYHFVYHDGIFEGFDNRKKIEILNLIHDYCTSKNIQYIISILDSDLPRDPATDQKIEFDKNDIVRILSDENDSGRLFNCVKF